MFNVLLSVAVVLFVFLLKFCHNLDNGLARTPPMGWMSWNYYRCSGDKVCLEFPDRCLNEQLILSVADAFYTQGYIEAGYEYIIIDDCWSEKSRDDFGNLVPSKLRFPNGMKYLADYIHARGLKFGMYTNIAYETCERYPGSRGYFDVDARAFAAWKVDYLKVDGCYVEEDFLNEAYIKLGGMLNKTGRPMVFACSWPYYIEFIHKKKPNMSPVQKHCNVYRNYHDIQMNFQYVKYISRYYTENYENMVDFHGPGGWNDPDMLLVGALNLTIAQSRIQMAIWAMLSAPLLLSCDMSKVSSQDRALLQNAELLAIAQDELGIMAKPVKLGQLLTLWVKKHLPMKGDLYHSFSFALVNFDSKPHSIFVYPTHHGLDSTDGYSVLNVFTKKFIMNVTATKPMRLKAPPEDVLLYTLFPL